MSQTKFQEHSQLLQHKMKWRWSWTLMKRWQIIMQNKGVFILEMSRTDKKLCICHLSSNSNCQEGTIACSRHIYHCLLFRRLCLISLEFLFTFLSLLPALLMNKVSLCSDISFLKRDSGVPLYFYWGWFELGYLKSIPMTK